MSDLATSHIKETAFRHSKLTFSPTIQLFNMLVTKTRKIKQAIDIKVF